MNSITINQFTNNLQNLIKQVINEHIPLKITNQDGADIVVISAIIKFGFFLMLKW